MNKKKLSVVMAGAMLATSVAPVLAEETTAKEYTESQTKLLANEVKTLMETEMVSSNRALIADVIADNVAIPATDDARFVSLELAKEIFNAKADKISVYGVAKVETNGVEKPVEYKVDAAVTLINDLDPGESIKVYKRTSEKFGGEVIVGSPITVTDSTVAKYTTAELVNGSSVDTAFENEAKLKGKQNSGAAVNGLSKLVKSIAVNTDKDGVVITLNALDENNAEKTIALKNGDEKLDFQLAYDKDGNLIDTTDVSQIQKFDHFGKKVNTYNKATAVKDKTLTATYKVVADKDENETLNASDLYDGFALTSKGTEILADLKNAADKAETTIDKPGTAGQPKGALVQLGAVTKTNQTTTGYCEFNVTYNRITGNNTAEVYKTITVRSTNENELNSLHKLLQKGEFNVGIVAGSNRYETAVNVSKAAGTDLAATAASDKTNNIVLVNGEALVDGLAAAPYAATVNGTGNQAAPILLSEADKLPTATKDYLKELTSTLAFKDIDDVTVTLIGGQAVLSDKVVSELEDMGFTVKRIGGDNREETSVKVAEKMPASNDTFIVGGNGEADAMSISAVAAAKKAPIIVAKSNVISADAISYLEDEASKDVVRIIGGENVFSKESEEKVNKALAKTNASYRISGSNRQATNAAVIKEYYNTKHNELKLAEGVVLVKDGMSKKSELVDALSAANYAVKVKAPIVLGTSKITDEQKNNLLNMSVSTDIPATKGIVAQVGEGANRTLLEKIAGLFNISNK